jgi:pyruvate/2-oxoglutarate/acetoin dehydrogenase E1 component
VARVSGFDVPYPVGMVEHLHVPNEERILAAVRQTLDAG